MKPLLLILALLFLLMPQKAQLPTELTRLREEFVKATNEYKASLTKLLTIYEGNVKKAEEKLELSQKLFSEGQISRIQVEENERQLASERAKVEETKRQMVNADEQIAEIFNETKLEQEYKRAVKQRRRARKPKCTNWTLTAYQRTTSNTMSFGYKLVCLN